MILIDNGHGQETPGKRSPDGTILEWKYARSLAKGVAEALRQAGVNARMLVPEDEDVPLRKRVERANSWPGAKLLVSIHINASGRGQAWGDAHGWSAYVAPMCSAESKRAARLMCQAAEKHNLHVRKPLPSEPFWRQSLAIVRDTLCPAVLTENMFMDNHADCQFLLSPEGMATLVDLHTKAILAYLKKK